MIVKVKRYHVLHRRKAAFAIMVLYKAGNGVESITGNRVCKYSEYSNILDSRIKSVERAGCLIMAAYLLFLQLQLKIYK